MTYAIVTVVVLILDQLLKFWTTKNIPLDAVGSDCVELLPNVLHLTNVHNYGAAFSILKNARWLLVAVTVIFAVAVIVLITQEIIRGDLGRWSAVLVMAGAVSNALDRALYGYVVDMFEFEFMNFAVFNIADIFITVCGILFCVYILFEKPSPEEAEAGEGGGLIALLKSRQWKRPSASRGGSHATTRRVREPEEDDGETLGTVELRSDEGDDAPRRSRSERRRAKQSAAKYVPAKRGEHKTLADELATIDPNDPFAEWNEGRESAASEKAEAAPETEPEVPSVEPELLEDTPDSLSFDDDLSFDLDDILSEFGDDT